MSSLHDDPLAGHLGQRNTARGIHQVAGMYPDSGSDRRDCSKDCCVFITGFICVNVFVCIYVCGMEGLL